MNKSVLVENIIKSLEEVLQIAKDSAFRAHATATHKENVAENKYDTLGLEASYLAQGQAKRVDDCEADLAAFKTLEIDERYHVVSIGCLIKLIDENENKQWLFLGPRAGGLKVKIKNFDGIEIQVTIVTPFAPLGKKLLKCSVEDDFELQIGQRSQFYYVAKVI